MLVTGINSSSVFEIGYKSFCFPDGSQHIRVEAQHVIPDEVIISTKRGYTKHKARNENEQE